MTLLATPPLPARRTDLIIRPISEGERYVVKDPGRGHYFEIGIEEQFLLTQLDGERTAVVICEAFEEQFGESLLEAELEDFVEMARDRGLVESSQSRMNDGRNGTLADHTSHRQSLLYWRKNVFDPDLMFNWLEPRIRFFWTPAFLLFSACCIGFAILILWTAQQAAASSFQNAVRWESVVLAWLVMVGVGLLHESAHGLTCKHFGGEVREIGFLLMYFMPCFYCNVSDAWLFRERSKRLWVTFAGGYFELFLWSLAVFVWRITMPDSLLNYLAFIVVVACGIETFFNFNPLIKLDGYYLLSDWMEIPNLRQRSFAYMMSWGRRLLWGGPRPEAEPKAKFLFGFGLVSWVYSLTFLFLMLMALWYSLDDALGVLGIVVAIVLGIASLRGLFSDLFREEFHIMISKRRGRTILWVIVVSGLVAASLIVPWTETAEGDFEMRALKHAEVRAPVAGFLKSVSFDEGRRVAEGAEMARLEIPDLKSRLAQKQAELREAEAKLKVVRAGPRDEELAQQKRRLAAAKAFRDVAAQNLHRQKRVLAHELIRFEKRLEECSAESDYAQEKFAIQENLRIKKAVTQIEYSAAKRAYLVACAQREQIKAQKQSRIALGTSLAESELAEREKELTHEQAVLALLEAGTRREEVEAAEAAVDLLREEIAYLEDQKQRLSIKSPVAGVITTVRLKQKVGDYFEEGELIGEVEDLGRFEVVITLDEDQAARVEPGQNVRLKARSRPFEVFEVKVERIAPRAETDDALSHVNVYCELSDPYGRFCSGMTGYARIECGRASIAAVFYKKCLRFIRTEFWW